MFHSYHLLRTAWAGQEERGWRGKGKYGINPPTDSLELLGTSSTHSIYWSSCRTALRYPQLSLCPGEGFWPVAHCHLPTFPGGMRCHPSPEQGVQVGASLTGRFCQHSRLFPQGFPWKVQHLPETIGLVPAMTNPEGVQSGQSGSLHSGVWAALLAQMQTPLRARDRPKKLMATLRTHQGPRTCQNSIPQVMVIC